MTNPTTLADFRQCMGALIADETLSAAARAAALSTLATTVASIPWRDAAAGRAMADEIRTHVDRSLDLLSGMDELAAAGRLQLAAEVRS